MQQAAIIMAGGTGERFWPLSRTQRPKQLLRLASQEESLLLETVRRIEPLIPAERIFIITGEQLLEPIRNELPFLPPENIIAEPMKRNTAPCLALATAMIAERLQRPPEEISVAVFAADHYIPDGEAFRAAVATALHHAEHTQDIVTLGITPTRPDTGYGYIETIPSEKNNSPITAVKSFREKPDFDTAVAFMRQGQYLWNSGMFFVRISTLWDNFKKHLPQVAEQLPALTEAIRYQCHLPLDTAPDGTRELFYVMPDVSIDYGVMEKTAHASVMRATFVWDDIGSWSALARLHKPDDGSNIVLGEAVMIDSKNCIVFHDDLKEERVVAVIGMNDTIIATEGNAILVCHASYAQDVKKAVTILRQAERDVFL